MLFWRDSPNAFMCVFSYKNSKILRCIYLLLLWAVSFQVYVVLKQRGIGAVPQLTDHHKQSLHRGCCSRAETPTNSRPSWHCPSLVRTSQCRRLLTCCVLPFQDTLSRHSPVTLLNRAQNFYMKHFMHKSYTCLSVPVDPFINISWRRTSELRWYHTERSAVATPPFYTLWPVAANIARTLTIEIAAAVGARRPAQARARRSATTPPSTPRDESTGGGAARRRWRRPAMRQLKRTHRKPEAQFSYLEENVLPYICMGESSTCHMRF